MPCQGPSDAECRTADNRVHVAELIVYFFTEMGITDEIPEEVHTTIEKGGWFPGSANDDFLASTLCNEIETSSVHDAHAIIYNARKKMSRKLADWWEDHQEEDAVRERKEKEDRERDELLASLTPRQKQLLGL